MNPSACTSSPLRAPARILPTLRTCQVSPDQVMSDMPQSEAPRYTLAKWIPVGDGTFRPRLQTIEVWARMKDLPSYGIPLPPETITRLATAGFIEMRKVAPASLMVNLDSLYAHLEACKDPEFWTKERIAKYVRDGMRTFTA